MVAKQRLQMNFQVKKDALFNTWATDSIITPLTFVKRESVMTQAQANAILGDLYTARKIKIGMTIGLCVLGALILIVAIVMLIKYKKVQRSESLGLSDEGSEAPFRKGNLIQNESHLDPSSLHNTLLEDRSLGRKKLLVS